MNHIREISKKKKKKEKKRKRKIVIKQGTTYTCYLTWST